MARRKKTRPSIRTRRKAITSKGGFIASSVIFLCAVVLLVTHAQTGLTVSTIGVCIAAATLLAAGKEGPGLLKKIDYETLLFFIGLFVVVVGGLEQTGVLKILAGIIEKVSGGNIALMIAIIVIVSAVASAFIDNIPFAATMIPVITNLAATTQVLTSPFFPGHWPWERISEEAPLPSELPQTLSVSLPQQKKDISSNGVNTVRPWRLLR